MNYVLASVAGILLIFSAQPGDARQVVTALVAKIQRADYEGDRVALKRLHGELAPFVQDRTLASRVLYWRGFALWRRSLNGFNESADRKEIDEDLTQAVSDFRDAAARDSAFADAKVGGASCLVNLSFLNMDNAARARELFVQSDRLLKRPSRPARTTRGRVGPGREPMVCAAGARRRSAGALATYERGLDLARKQQGRVTDPLEPTWGEAELLMNLAFAT